MTALAAVTLGLLAAACLLVAGYQLGLARGRRVRDELREQQRHLMAAAPPDPERIRQELQTALEPLLHREQLGRALAHLDPGTGRREELPRLLDDIAATGSFSAVLLSDDAGLPLSFSAGTRNPERYAGLASVLMTLVERLARDPGPAPVAVLVHNTANEQMLSRLFQVSHQRLMLTAIASSSDLSATALDPALHKLEAVLTTAAPAPGRPAV